jgi:hypothetical protein
MGTGAAASVPMSLSAGRCRNRTMHRHAEDSRQARRRAHRFGSMRPGFAWIVHPSARWCCQFVQTYFEALQRCCGTSPGRDSGVYRRERRMRSIIRTMGLLAAIAVAVLAMQASALAAPPDVVGPENGSFLCPAVGHGVTNADARNGDNGVSTIGPIGSGDQSFLPGNNQAGAKSNPAAHNTEGPVTSPGPGDGNSDWSPIWPAPTS